MSSVYRFYWHMELTLPHPAIIIIGARGRFFRVVSRTLQTMTLAKTLLGSYKANRLQHQGR